MPINVVNNKPLPKDSKSHLTNINLANKTFGIREII